ncbi:MAG: Ig domain-containing protein [Candidatus Sumerlaeia bacterium]
MRIFRLGNSHTNSVKEEFLGLVGAAGHKNLIHDQHTVPGAPIRWLYYKAKKDSEERLRNNAWDVVIFQTYNSTNEEEKQAIIEYTKAAREGNPDVRVILYTIWPSDQSLTLLPGDEWFNKEQLADEWGRYEGWTEEVAERLRTEFPGMDVAVAPTSLVIRTVGGMADAGLIPGLTGYSDLTQDAGHMGLYGGYAIGATFSAMIFNESPIGYPPQMLKYGNDQKFTDEVILEVKPEAALAIQKVVWDILAQYDQDQLDTGLWINSGRMIPALLGKKYDRSVPVVNAAGDVKLSLKSGSLPDGIALKEGRLVGTPKEKGVSEFTLAASDGEKTVERSIILAVEEEQPLRVRTVEKSLQADEYLLDSMQAIGAIGKAKWKILDGTLPAGLIIQESGLIKGTPAEEGEFEVTVEATDRHPEGARSARGKLMIKVGPPSKGTVIVPVVNTQISRKQSLAEQDLSAYKFDNKILNDAGEVVAEFAIGAYRGDERFRKKRPDTYAQLGILVKVYEDKGGDFPMESVHVYFDTNHTREVIYNEDDEHWMIPRGGRREQVAGYRPTRHFMAVTEDMDGGWIMGATQSKPSGYGVHALSTPVTYGFNIAVGSKDDPTKRYYWKGDARSDKDTSVFGSILVEKVKQ